ncbi:MAG: hypothetical protein R3E46_11880 [Sedimenticolaceae bacterium]
MAGGIGAKKVDVTWATEEGGLLLGISIKTINFRDNKTKNFQRISQTVVATCYASGSSNSSSPLPLRRAWWVVLLGSWRS